MTDETPQTSSEASATPEATPVGSTLEEIEASFAHRMSQRDRAHNAETESLRKQIADLQAAQSSAPPSAPESAEAAQIRELQAQLEQSKREAASARLMAKYPETGAILQEETGYLSEAKLAAFEAVITGEKEKAEAPIIDQNAAPRAMSAQSGVKALSEKTKDELLADLRQASPGFQQALREGQNI